MGKGSVGLGLGLGLKPHILAHCVFLLLSFTPSTLLQRLLSIASSINVLFTDYQAV